MNKDRLLSCKMERSYNRWSITYCNLREARNPCTTSALWKVLVWTSTLATPTLALRVSHRESEVSKSFKSTNRSTMLTTQLSPWATPSITHSGNRWLAKCKASNLSSRRWLTIWKPKWLPQTWERHLKTILKWETKCLCAKTQSLSKSSMTICRVICLRI